MHLARGIGLGHLATTDGVSGCTGSHRDEDDEGKERRVLSRHSRLGGQAVGSEIGNTWWRPNTEGQKDASGQGRKFDSVASEPQVVKLRGGRIEGGMPT